MMGIARVAHVCTVFMYAPYDYLLLQLLKTSFCSTSISTYERLKFPPFHRLDNFTICGVHIHANKSSQ
jgi:hypothetical protein